MPTHPSAALYHRLRVMWMVDLDGDVKLRRSCWSWCRMAGRADEAGGFGLMTSWERGFVRGCLWLQAGS